MCEGAALSLRRNMDMVRPGKTKNKKNPVILLGFELRLSHSLSYLLSANTRRDIFNDINISNGPPIKSFAPSTYHDRLFPEPISPNRVARLLTTTFSYPHRLCKTSGAVLVTRMSPCPCLKSRSQSRGKEPCHSSAEVMGWR